MIAIETTLKRRKFELMMFNRDITLEEIIDIYVQNVMKQKVYNV